MNLQKVTSILDRITNIAKYLGTHKYIFIFGFILIIVLFNLKRIANSIAFIILFFKIKSGEKENAKQSNIGKT